MRSIGICLTMSSLIFLLSSCSTYHADMGGGGPAYEAPVDFASRMPGTWEGGERVVVVDPRVHAWAAYGEDGSLVRAGQVSAGSDYCPDLGRACRTTSGTFRIHSLGDASCISHKFPIPHGGSPMPYCMYFSGGQALHGVPDSEVRDANISHGCVRMHVADAEWLRFNFARVGTKVVVNPY